MVFVVTKGCDSECRWRREEIKRGGRWEVVTCSTLWSHFVIWRIPTCLRCYVIVTCASYKSTVQRSKIHSSTTSVITKLFFFFLFRIYIYVRMYVYKKNYTDKRKIFIQGVIMKWNFDLIFCRYGKTKKKGGENSDN